MNIKLRNTKVSTNIESTSDVDLVKDEVTIRPAAQLIAACFEARTKAHMWHLRTNSYAAHVALNSFYDSLVGLVDSYAESYQGIYGIIQEYPGAPFIDDQTPMSVVGSLHDFISSIRQDCGTQSELQNEIDSIMTLCNSTQYKLQNLK